MIGGDKIRVSQDEGMLRMISFADIMVVNLLYLISEADQ
jgi:hypothetical protein